MWLKNPGNLGSTGANWEGWEQNMLIVGGPDVALDFFNVEADGVTYDVMLTGKAGLAF